MMYISILSVISLPDLCIIVNDRDQWLSRQSIGRGAVPGIVSLFVVGLSYW